MRVKARNILGPGLGEIGMVGSISRPLLFLLLGIAAFHVMTMPVFFYPGDNFVPRAACANLLNNGEIGIDYSQKQVVAEFLRQRGQYFYENDEAGRLYSKYGIGNTLLYLPPLLAEKIYSGRLELVSNTLSQLFFMNIYSVVLTLIAALYLYKIVSLYSDRSWLRIVFVLLLFYGTYVWYYLRSPTLEIFQIFPFLGFYYHMVRFMRCSGSAGEEREEQGEGEKQVEGEKQGKGGGAKVAGKQLWMHLTLAMLYVGLLILLKLFFVLLLIAVWIFAVLAGPVGTPAASRMKLNLSRYRSQYLLYLGLPSLVIILLVLGINQLKFGSMFESGYGQWLDPEGLVHDRFDLKVFSTAFSAFLFGKGNANIFVHCPLLLFGLFGLPLFIRKHRTESLFLLFVFLSHFLVLCCFSSWRGERCYGPRYLLLIAMIGSLPFIRLIEWLCARRLKALAGAALALICAVLVWSAGMQVRVNSLHYFVYHNTKTFFAEFGHPQIDRYFNSLIHRGILHRDLIAHREGRRVFPPVKVLIDTLPPERRSEILRPIDQYIIQVSQSNYLLF